MDNQFGSNGSPWKVRAKAGNVWNFINMDGSRYGSKGVARFGTSPTVIGWVACDTALSVAITGMLRGETMGVGSVIHGFAVLSLFGGLPAAGIGWNVFNHYLPVSQKTGIDKTGYSAPEPAVTVTMQKYYNKTSLISAGATIGCFLGWYAMIPSIPEIAEVFTMMASAGTLPIMVCSAFASRKLKQGDWTVVANPPKKPELQGSRKRSLALMPS